MLQFTDRLDGYMNSLNVSLKQAYLLYDNPFVAQIQKSADLLFNSSISQNSNVMYSHGTTKRLSHVTDVMYADVRR